MAKKKKGSKKAEDQSPNSQTRRRKGILAGLVLLLFALWAYWAIWAPDPEESLIAELEAQGLAFNPGLTDRFVPGTLIQISDQQGTLPSPLLIKSAQECFPGRTPRSSPFALRQRTGSGSGTLKLGLQELLRLLPQLDLQGDIQRRWSLAIEKARLLEFSRIDLSEAFSPACVQALEAALNQGDRQEWFAVIDRAITADSLRLSQQESSQLRGQGGAQARAKTVRSELGGSTPGSITVQGEQTTVLETASGPFVLAYGFRPIQGVKER